jgi:hypothetical protein
MVRGTPSLIHALQRRGIATAAELAGDLSVSQPTVSRLLAASRDELVVLGRARSARYAARDLRSQFCSGVPVYRVGPTGSVGVFGTLIPLVRGVAWIAKRSLPRHYPGLPWFIEEMRPQGFLGRISARVASTRLGVPIDPRLWTSEHLLRALVAHADDSPGDLLVGEPARERYLARVFGDARPVARRDYAALIEAQLAGELPGSSAGGEQPKFACWSGSQHLLVKYSPPVAGSSAARRWADLLRAEAVALEVLRHAGIRAASATYVEQGGRAYLEVERFDRTKHGRLGVVTGTLVDAEFVGAGDWLGLGAGLARAKLISEGDAETMSVLRAFGGIIGNTDMHLGNVAFFTDDYESFRLAPAYDMLPMGLRPTAQGEVIAADPPMPHPTPESLREWRRAAELAREYFAALRRNRKLDRSFEHFARERDKRLAALVGRAARLADE